MVQFLCLVEKNLNSSCGVDFQYSIKNKLCLRAYYGLFLFCFCVICVTFILSLLFLISVNRSFIRFRGNTPGHVFSGFLDYCILVFEVAICLVVWGRWDLGVGYFGFGCGIFRLCLRVFTTRLQ